MRECIFLNFSRLLVKDEIKKGSINLKLGVGQFTASSKQQLTITDHSGSNGYYVNSPAGEYGILFASGSDICFKKKTGASAYTGGRRACGLVFYQAGVCVLTASLFATSSTNMPGGFLNNATVTGSSTGWHGATADPPRATMTAGADHTLRQLIGTSAHTGSTITDICDGIRNKFIDLSFNNTTELNSTIYFCRANHNEFNYSSNPTYLNNSELRVKGGDILTPPRSYVTTVGLYSADNELLATAKLSEPLRKDPTNELTLRVRLDY